MKIYINLISIILAFILLTYGVNNLSKPSNMDVFFGVTQIILSIFLLYQPIKSLYKKL